MTKAEAFVQNHESLCYNSKSDAFYVENEQQRSSLLRMVEISSEKIGPRIFRQEENELDN